MRDNRRVNSLMYHDLVEDSDTSASGFSGAAADRYKQTPANFELHLDAIEQRCDGIRKAVSVDRALSNDPEKLKAEPPQKGGRAERTPWLLTFDDGGVSAVDVAERLQRRNSIGHFLVTTAKIGSAGFLDADQIRALHDAGHVIGAHSHTHPVPISALTFEELVDEWQQSVTILEQILNKPVTVASVPGGFYSKQVATAAASAGIRTLFTSEPQSRIELVGECTVLGRYTILRRTSPQVAAAFAAGDLKACLQQRLTWTTKKAIKWFLGTGYVRSTRKVHELLKSKSPTAVLSTRNG